MSYEPDYEIVHFGIELLEYAVPEQAGFALVHFMQIDGRSFRNVTIDRGADGEWKVMCDKAQVAMKYDASKSFRPIDDELRAEVEVMVLSFLAKFRGQ